ncbi:MAG: PA14 domain-containing protein, partial [Segetibacter sp.]
GPFVSDKGESYRFELKQNSISTTVRAYKCFRNGTPDLSYGTIETTFPFVMKLFNTALLDDGKVLLVGSVQDFRIGDYIVVARFNLDGSLDFYNTKKRIYSSGYLIPAKLIKQGDQIILFSYFALADVTQPTGQDYIDVFSSSGDGSYTISPWRTRSQYYAPNLSTYSLQKNIAIGRSNVIVAGPEANQIPLPPLWPLPDYGYYISKYGSGGNPDLTFGTNGKIPYPNIGDSRYMLIDDNEKLLVANTVANPVTGNNDFRVIRFNKDGSFDQTFNGTGFQTTDFGGDDSPNSIVVHDGKIIVAGVTTNTITGEKQFAIARYNDDGTLDNSFSEDGKQTLGEAGNAYMLDKIKIKDNKLLALGTAVSSTGDSAKVTAAYLLTVSNPPVCTATGSILREYWANVSGTLISDIPLNTTPSSTSQLSSFEAPTDIADNYAQRIRGYICAPATGNYTFYISGDDESELWLSTSDNPADKRKIASVGGMQWTNPREWTKFESQKSVTIFLQANTKYYIEALNKEGAGGDNLAVGWITPGSADITVIPGSVLSPFTGTTTNPPVCTATGSILREYWANVSGTLISDIPVNTTPSSTSQLSSFEAPTDIADNYAQRIRGYICAPATGNYTFYISGDDESELWLSNSDNPADKRKIASVGGMQWTNPREWTKYETQKSVTIFLQVNTKYYIEALNKEGTGGDNLAVGWITP